MTKRERIEQLEDDVSGICQVIDGLRDRVQALERGRTDDRVEVMACLATIKLDIDKRLPAVDDDKPIDKKWLEQFGFQNTGEYLAGVIGGQVCYMSNDNEKWRPNGYKFIGMKTRKDWRDFWRLVSDCKGNSNDSKPEKEKK